MKGTGHSQDQVVHGNIIMKLITEKLRGKERTGCIWLTNGTSGGILWTQ